MNIFKVIMLINKFYELRTQFFQVRDLLTKGEIQFPPVVISFISETETFFNESRDVLKGLKNI